LSNNNQISNILDKYNSSDYPEKVELIGNNPIEGELKIFVNKSVINEIDAFLSADLLNECGGVLLGNVYKNNSDELFIVSDSFIIAKKTISGISKLTFTHDTWQEINNEFDKYHNNKIILGWFHSHPGHGVFLSGYDIFIQENFFNEEYMIAYVYDPVNKENAFFNWNNTKLSKSKGYFLILDGFKLSLDLNESEFQRPKNEKKSSHFGSKKFILLFIVLLLINMICTTLLFIDNYNLKIQIENIRENNMKLISLKNTIEKMEVRVNDLMLKQLNQQDSIKNIGNNK
jgi:proteasome lid subunit RPN8/RPN11